MTRTTSSGSPVFCVGTAKPTTEACAAIWQHVAFCNLVQRIMANHGEQPTEDDYAEGVEHLRQVLAALMPDRVLVTGQQAWGAVQPLVADYTPPIAFAWIPHPAQGGGNFQYAHAIPAFEELLAA